MKRLELELELIQPHMTQKPMLRGEGGGRACAHKQDPKKLLENNHWEGVLRKSAPGIIPLLLPPLYLRLMSTTRPPH